MTNALWSIISVGDGFEFLPKVGDKILIDQRLKSIGTISHYSKIPAFIHQKQT
jgi:hypothetical protein